MGEWQQNSLFIFTAKYQSDRTSVDVAPDLCLKKI